MQTRILMVIIVMLTFLIFLAASLQLRMVQEHGEISDTATLCSAYYHYTDDTHKTISAVEKLCWRTDDPTDNQRGL